jgi:hypothetical protein
MPAWKVPTTAAAEVRIPMSEFGQPNTISP